MTIQSKRNNKLVRRKLQTREKSEKSDKLVKQKTNKQTSEKIHTLMKKSHKLQLWS